MAGELHPEVHDFRSPEQWRWTLREAGGKFLTDHEVRLGVGDRRFTAFWQAVFAQVMAGEEGQEFGPLVVRAGPAAVPYLLRLREWDQACGLLEQVLVRDRSQAVAGVVAPGLRQIAEAVRGTDAEPATVSILAWALERVWGAPADVEDERGHGQRAIGLHQDALRYAYAAHDVAALAVLTDPGTLRRTYAQIAEAVTTAARSSD
ncbi:hypothetical protein GCM10010156_34590 [Planobispora rosea]|uniref:Uncharacterized protein n=1 Tax=Planobispora rosea TaxID=35762 RepID=A0A8J3WDN3_PLARO|nr:hypothetical protein [Planobispora rosea]GGS72785.1 hypothetical protein GCM10010156_34590 [Planobispora rosea]GIH85323.1 hypothetical protein Pro02_37310 [Planobispora rosea]